MARAENWDYCKANLAANKNYYVIARVVMGAWKARVSLAPIRAGDKETDAQIQAWLKGNPTKVDSTQRDAYVSRQLPDVKRGIDRFNTGKGKFSELTPADGRLGDSSAQSCG